MQIGLSVFLDGDISQQNNAYIPVATIADNQWHYICVDMYQGILNSWSANSTTYPNYRLTLIKANII